MRQYDVSEPRERRGDDWDRAQREQGHRPRDGAQGGGLDKIPATLERRGRLFFGLQSGAEDIAGVPTDQVIPPPATALPLPPIYDHPEWDSIGEMIRCP